MSICINSKHERVEIELKGKDNLVCLANGQMKHLLESHDLLCTKGSNDDTLGDGCPRRWCQKGELMVVVVLQDPFLGGSRW